jgi:hypothetical protein
VEYYCGGFNCGHRWEPALVQIKEKVLIHPSWERKYNESNKNDKKVMTEELQGAKILAKFGKVEMNAIEAKKIESLKGGDIDLFFKNQPTQLKQTKVTKTDGLREIFRDAKKTSRLHCNYC